MMTRHALLAAFVAMTMASGVSRAATFAAYGLPAAVDSTPTGAAGFMGVSSLSQITRLELTWAWDGQASNFVGDIALGSPSPAANTEGWALVPEPATWTVMLLGSSVVGASLRARRRLLPGRAHAKIRGRR